MTCAPWTLHVTAGPSRSDKTPIRGAQRGSSPLPKKRPFVKRPTAPSNRSRTPPAEISLVKIPQCRWSQHASSILLCSSGCIPMPGQSRSAAPDSRVRKALNRQSRSCKVCRSRKVKVCVVLVAQIVSQRPVATTNLCHWFHPPIYTRIKRA